MRLGTWGQLVGIVFVGLLVIGEAHAHDVWIMIMPDGAATLRAVVHHGHPGDPKTPDPDKLFEFIMQGSRQPTQSLLAGVTVTLQDGIPVLMTNPLTPPNEASLTILAARYDNGYWVKMPFGHRNTSKRQVRDGEESLYSMKFAKALLQKSSEITNAYQQNIGHRLELIPVSNPFASKPGDDLMIQVDFDGKPLPDSDVESGDGITPRDEKDIPRFRTDKQGIAVIPITRRGPHLFVVDHLEASIHPDLASQELYNATLSFVLP
ncbi:MAG: DUF4198 domain-containing protein [Nitrospirales bacterium]